MKRLSGYAFAITLLSLALVGSTLNRLPHHSGKRSIASDPKPRFHYRVTAIDQFSREVRTFWPPYAPMDSLEHPGDFCDLQRERAEDFTVEQLDENGVYRSCGTCAKFHCVTPVTTHPLREQASDIHRLLRDYLDASSREVVDYFLRFRTVTEKIPLSSCEGINVWPCNSRLNIEDTVRRVRTLPISTEALESLDEKVTAGSDSESVSDSVKKHVFLALTLLDDGFRSRSLEKLHGFKIQNKTRILFSPVDSMYIPWIFTPGRIVLRERIAVNDSYKQAKELNNVHGIRAWVAILHEYGHFLDDLFSDHTLRIFKSREGNWKTLTEQDDAISFYSLYSMQENFAESFAAYLLDPLFRCYAPDRHAFMAAHVRINQEVYGGPGPFSQIDCGHKAIQNALKGRRAILTQNYGSSLLAMKDQIPLIVDGDLRKKPPGSACRKDDYCDNEDMGCQSGYRNFFRLHVGRCRGAPGSLKSDDYCDRNAECASDRCSRHRCR